MYRFAPSYRTIYARCRLRNLVAARQNVLYSINFLGTGGVADEIAASLSYTKWGVLGLFSWLMAVPIVTTVFEAPVV